MMSRTALIYAACCGALLILLSAANARGYIITNLFTGADKADKSAGNYHK
jgi:hypothetical protein